MMAMRTSGGMNGRCTPPPLCPGINDGGGCVGGGGGIGGNNCLCKFIKHRSIDQTYSVVMLHVVDVVNVVSGFVAAVVVAK
jgi:hypothetical protein